MKKQILKTSVLAAVLLSMGMGMAHASTGGATLNVTATLGAATCELDVKGGGVTGNNGAYQLDIGKVNTTDISVLNPSTTPPSAKNIEVNLVKCGPQYGATTANKFTPNAAIEMNVFGQTIDADKKIFNANSAADAGVAVYDHAGKAVKSGDKIQLTTTNEIDLSKPLALTQGEGMAAFKVGLVSKSSTLPKAQEVIAPVTFQVVYK
ncbi:hypothetical protein TI10_05945 [Photorhabdus luminescens subsp. luminescens]|uniref:Fimbrial protein n=1 Tax=Photorhabdus luminescens TaxID=29488 RepID=A0A1G5PZH5_PHOLU|nr:type 1 fimbrial protein [Photorhabdus luminescens]KMW73774.1 hypothetical protein TI10_05945 [Photorhabdus luminescens subsp. luminescens]SCZ54995.1 Fimbrial protein [Photorhabdus luminescens]